MTSHLKASRSRWWVVVALIPSLWLVGADNAMVTTALPSIGRALDASLSDLQWVVVAYSLANVAFLPVSAAIGDFVGRKRAVIAGYLLFTAGSLAAATASSIGPLLAARVPQGIGVALSLSNGLAILGLSFPPAERGRAIGLWTGLASIGLVVGPLVGGLLIEAFGWNAVFLPNVAVGLAGVVMVWRLVPEVGERRRVPLDLVGLITASTGLFALTFGLVEGGRSGLSRSVVGALLIGCLALAGFVVWERRTKNPLLDLSLLSNPSFGPVLGISFLAHIGLMSAFFFMSIALQGLRGLTPAEAGAVMIGFTLPLVVAPIVGGRLVDRIGFRSPLLLGVGMLAGGVAAMASVAAEAPLWVPALAMFVAGWGGGTMLAAEGTAVVSAPPSDQVSSASAALSAARQSGISLGIALLGAVAALSFRAATESGLIAAGVDPAAAEAIAADATIGAVNSAAQQGSEMVGGVLLEAAGEALVLTFLLAALALVASLVLGLTTLRRRRAATTGASHS